MKRFLLILGFCLMVASSCIPQSPTPTPFPSETIQVTSIPSPIPPTSTAMITLASPTLGAVSSMEPYLSDIQMTSKTSGWVWEKNREREERLLHTSDGGQTWKDVTPEGSIYTSFLLDDQTAWLSIGKKLLMTSDGGTTWKVVNENVWDAFIQITTDWFTLRFADQNHGWLNPGYAAAGAHEFYYETWDGGATWQPMDFGTLPEEFTNHGNYPNELAFWSVIDVIYYDANRFIIVPGDQEGDLQLYLSSDGRKTWQTVPLPSAVFSGQSFEIYDRNSYAPTFFTDREGSLSVRIWDRYEDRIQLFLYGTSDGGSTWTLDAGPVVLQNPKSDLVFLSQQDVLYVCGASVCKTNDAGNTWQTLEFGALMPIDLEHASFQLDFVDPLTGWLLLYMLDDNDVRLNSRLLKTTDGGSTWQDIQPIIER